MGDIRVALVGVGSLAKALVQGVSFYTRHPDETAGLMHPRIGNYSVRDIKFVATFDVDERKVGKPLHEAIVAPPNVGVPITEPIHYDARVHRGPTLDGVAEEMKGSFVRESNVLAVDVAATLLESKAEVVVNLVPSGSDCATYAYAEAALEAGCSFINCIPTPLATAAEWRKQFEKKGRVLLGDDIKSQFGATMLNRSLLALLKMRGITVVRSEQENIGGNTDHVNLLYRTNTKEHSKKGALTCFLDQNDADPKVTFCYTGEPSGHKRVNLKIEGELFGRIPISITSVMEDEISVNGAGTIVDAIRMAKFLADTGRQKEAARVCAFLMKSSPEPMTDAQAWEMFENVLRPISAI